MHERRAWSARLRSTVHAEVLHVRRRKFNRQALKLVRRRVIWIWGSGCGGHFLELLHRSQELSFEVCWASGWMKGATENGDSEGRCPGDVEYLGGRAQWWEEWESGCCACAPDRGFWGGDDASHCCQCGGVDGEGLVYLGEGAHNGAVVEVPTVPMQRCPSGWARLVCQ